MKVRISLISLLVFCLVSRTEAFQVKPDVLPGTKLLTGNDDLSVKMLDGAHKFIERKIEESIVDRSKSWNRNFNSREEYERSIEPNRNRFIKYIGVEDKTAPFKNFNLGLPDKNPPVLLMVILK